MVENSLALIPVEKIESSIFFIRGHKIMLDNDLAILYGVETKNLTRSVKRNIARFPEDFMFQLTEKEFNNLKRHLKNHSFWGGRRHLPYAFTEQGLAMLSGVINSPRAIMVNVEIMRAFVRLRRMLASNEELARKLEIIERKYDSQFKVVFEAIKNLMNPPERPKRDIGFIKKTQT